jgi:tetratricopeptide (TPR) repeat protein
MLRAKITDCDAVLHIVGIRYGAEPDPTTLPEGQPRLSYTQLEAKFARDLGKKLYLFLCPDDFPFDDFPQEPEALRALQLAYRDRVRADRQLRTTIRDGNDISLRVRELQAQIESLRETVSTLGESVSNTKNSNKRLFALGALGLLILAGTIALVLNLSQKSDQQSTHTQRIEDKLDQTLNSFSRERELLTKVLDTSLQQNAAYEKLTPEQRFNAALREIALQESMPVEQLQSTLDIFITKVKALGEKADSLDRVLVAQKDLQFEKAVEIADEGIAKLEEEDAKLAKTEENFEKAADTVRQQREANLRKRFELLIARGRALDSRYQYQDAAETFRDAEELIGPANRPDHWSFARSSRISSLANAGIRIDIDMGNSLLQQAEILAREHLETFPKESSQENWSRAQVSLGRVLNKLGTRLQAAEGTNALNDAIEAYQSALTFFSAEEHPVDWAYTHSNLADSLTELSTRLPEKEGVDALRNASKSFSQALTVFAKDQFPSHWASSLTGLGSVLFQLGQRSSGEESMEALQSARMAITGSLIINTKEHFPEEWAMTHYNIGQILHEMGRRKSSNDLFLASVGHFKESLTVFSKEDEPQIWSEAQAGLGGALTSFAIGRPDKEKTTYLNISMDAYKEALEVITKESLPLRWAALQVDTGKIHKNLGIISHGSSSIEAFESASKAYKQALTVYTKEHHPLAWAGTHEAIGELLHLVGKHAAHKDKVELFGEARKAFANALEVYNEGTLPIFWASTQARLGVLHIDAVSSDNTDIDNKIICKLAFEHFQNALRVHTLDADVNRYGFLTSEVLRHKASASYIAFLAEDFPLAEDWAHDGLKSDSPLVASVNLAHALLFQGKYDEALALYQNHWNNPEKTINVGTFREAVIADFEEMAEKGLTHADLGKLKKALSIHIGE